MSPALRLVGLPAQQSRQRIEAGDPMVMQFDGEAADARSKVMLQLEYDPQGFVKKVGDAIGRDWPARFLLGFSKRFSRVLGLRIENNLLASIVAVSGAGS